MVLFDAAELADLQALWGQSLDDVATILRPSVTVGAGGGRVVTWGTAGTAAARWQPTATRGTETPTAGAVWAVGPMVVMLPAGTDVQEQDRLRRGGDASLWEVKGTSAPRSFDYGMQVDVVSIGT
jgi:hypothetical protein